MSSLFNMDIKFLKGIGDNRAKLFNKLGIFSVGSLLIFYPKKYKDFSFTYSISEAPIGKICCVKAIVSSKISKQFIRKGMTIYKLKVSDEYSNMNITFFNTSYIINKFIVGKEYLFYGKIENKHSSKHMNSPDFKINNDFDKIFPIYSTTNGLSSNQIASSVKNAILLLPKVIKEPIPLGILKKYNLSTLEFAIKNIHFPKTNDELLKARKRLIFEEFLIFQLGLNILKKRPKLKTLNNLNKSYLNEFKSLLPFELTNSQKNAIEDCIKDMMNKSYSMNRLIQGDVGCGKTAVAAALAYNAFRNFMQVSIMVPTEILARQHFNWFKNIFKKTEAKIELLISATKRSDKKRIKDSLKSGNINILIGTHALISDDVEFSSLGLVITDEQHRFGVAQRNKLISKGKSLAHTLIMSATPIPRTLALIIYSDLDISIIDELPKGRKKINTHIINSSKRHDALTFIKNRALEGKQSYIVCPLVEESDSELFSVKSYFTKIKNEIFYDINVGLVHGKMKSIEKETIMKKFKEGKILVLVATTVVEVGVDVPNAVIMMVENAERFGLSQLHQLRGRVGRGKDQSYFIMVSDIESENTTKRFKIMTKTNNGFEIADQDLKLRGPGDFFGEKQHGIPEFRIANILNDHNILLDSKNAADKILKEDPELNLEKNKNLKLSINQLFFNKNQIN